jgi:glycosyltransferase involved in cell wall biosynthesis
MAEAAAVRSPAERLRVLFVHGTLEIGGAEEARLSLLRCLDRSRSEASVCCLQAGGPIAEEIATLGYDVTVLGQRAHALSLATLGALRRVIRERRPHVVQTSLPRANYWGRLAAFLERVPVVVAEEHSVAEAADWARPLLECVLGPRTSCVVACSESVRDAVIAKGGASARRPTVVISNPVDDHLLEPRRGREEVRRELGVREGQILVLHVGRMDAHQGPKRQDLLIQAARAAAEGRADIVCALAGDGPGRPALEALAAGLGGSCLIRFLGFRRDIADLLVAADIFAFPSDMEGMPIALMEAMWMGLPVVASCIPGNWEALGRGRFGRFVPAGSVRALAHTLRELAADGQARAALGLAAQAHARVACAPRRYSEQMAALWDQLLRAAVEAGRHPARTSRG